MSIRFDGSPHFHIQWAGKEYLAWIIHDFAGRKRKGALKD
jgi:hypothetical protein